MRHRAREVARRRPPCSPGLLWSGGGLEAERPEAWSRTYDLDAGEHRSALSGFYGHRSHSVTARTSRSGTSRRTCRTGVSGSVSRERRAVDTKRGRTAAGLIRMGWPERGRAGRVVRAGVRDWRRRRTAVGGSAGGGGPPQLPILNRCLGTWVGSWALGGPPRTPTTVQRLPLGHHRRRDGARFRGSALGLRPGACPGRSRGGRRVRDNQETRAMVGPSSRLGIDRPTTICAGSARCSQVRSRTPRRRRTSTGTAAATRSSTSKPRCSRPGAPDRPDRPADPSAGPCWPGAIGRWTSRSTRRRVTVGSSCRLRPSTIGLSPTARQLLTVRSRSRLDAS